MLYSQHFEVPVRASGSVAMAHPPIFLALALRFVSGNSVFEVKQVQSQSQEHQGHQDQAGHSNHSKGLVALFSIPAVGHVSPLVALAEEFARRGWDAVIVSTEHDFQSLGVRFASMPCGELWQQSRTKLQNHMKEKNNDLNGTHRFWDSVQFGLRSLLEDEFWDCCLEYGEKILLREKPDLMVVDASTFVGIDIAEKLNISYIVNNPALIDIHDSPECMPPATYLPGVLSGQSILERSTTKRLTAVMSPLMQLAQTCYIYFYVHRPLNARRVKAGFPAREYSLCPKHKLILVEQVLGVEYPRPIPPLMQFVGYLERKKPFERLESWESDWLEAAELPVIYVSFGTVFSLQNRANVLLEGLSSETFRVLWSLKTLGEVNRSLPSNVRIAPWVSSQIQILGHRNVHAFISHCGDNSLYESIKMGTPLLCIPIGFDQLDCAMRAFDAGVARVLDKQSFTPEDIRREIAYILQEQLRFQANLRRAQDLLKLAGGVTRAADLVEHVHAFGTQHLSGVRTQYIWQDYDWDVLFIQMSILTLCCSVLKRFALFCGKSCGLWKKQKRD